MGGRTSGGGGSGGAPPRSIPDRRPFLCCASCDKTIAGATGQHVNSEELENIGQQLHWRLQRDQHCSRERENYHTYNRKG